MAVLLEYERVENSLHFAVSRMRMPSTGKPLPKEDVAAICKGVVDKLRHTHWEVWCYPLRNHSTHPNGEAPLPFGWVEEEELRARE